jgi:enterochelin esterase-like enzyme
VGYQFRVSRAAAAPELILDKLNPRVDSGLGRRSMFVAERAAGSQWLEPRPDVPHGRVERVTLRLSGRDTAQAMWVYTPPGYDRQRSDTAALLVLFDGGAYMSSTIVGTPTILDNLIAERRIMPVVALFLPQELGPSARQATMGNNAAYAKVIAEEAIPWVQTNYRVSRDPTKIVIGGSSLGGLAASHVALHYPQVVRNVLSQSGSYQWPAPDDPTPEWLTRRLASLPAAPVRVYLEAGIFEVGASPSGLTLLAANRRFRDALRTRGYDVTYREVHGGHEYLSWRGTIVSPLLLFFGARRDTGSD